MRAMQAYVLLLYVCVFISSLLFCLTMALYMNTFAGVSNGRNDVISVTYSMCLVYKILGFKNLQFLAYQHRLSDGENFVHF